MKLMLKYEAVNEVIVRFKEKSEAIFNIGSDLHSVARDQTKVL